MSDTPLVDSCEQAYLRQTGDAINQDAIWVLARKLEYKLAAAETALTTIGGGWTDRFPGAPDPMNTESPLKFQSDM